MIVDTSALAAIAMAEPHWEALLAALADSKCVVPASVLTELQLATPKRGPLVAAAASALVEQLLEAGAKVAPFGHRHTIITAAARNRYGKGNGKGGKLNFGDLLVYAVAKDRGEPLLCTGTDFASTDLLIHPASRLEP